MSMSTAVMVAAAGAEDDEGLTAAIRREHEAASTAAQSAIEHALEAGRLLAQAREGIPHGGWESFVREHCGIAPRTARLYMQLDARRDRIGNRQHVAGLTLREAARLVAEPKATAPPQAEPPVACDAVDAAARWGLRLKVPAWYRPGHRHFGSHCSGWCFETWPHPAGVEWAHFYVCSPLSGYPGEEGGNIVGPKRGIAVAALEWAIEKQTVNGMPSLDDAGWKITDSPCRLDDAGDAIADRFKPYNSLLFRDEDDYRRRGMEIQPRRKAGPGASE
jgi:hypothetical protein